MTEPTPHFGLTTVGEGESIDKDGYKALLGDRFTLDNLIYALFNRSFNGDPALGDPTDPPTLALHSSGGALPASTTLYYRASYVDIYGLESAASDEASVTTPDPIEPPTAPALAVDSTGGTIISGTYNYVITQVDADGGETTVSPLATVQVGTGSTNTITLTMPDLDVIAVKFRIYRSRPGQSSLYFVAEATGDYVDIGLGEDQTVMAPSSNTTSSRCSITVTAPGGFIPEQAMSWRIYRTTASGDYDQAALVHEVVEPATADSPIPTTVYLDDGGDLLIGQPREISATAPQGPQLDVGSLTGSLPLATIPRGVRCLSSYAAGVLTDGRVINVTESPAPVQPVRLTAFFATPPTSPVTIRVADGTHHVDLVCSGSFHRSGDAAGFWRKEFPLLLAAQFEAEDGVRSAPEVLIDPDVAAYSGQAVTLETNGQWVQADLGVLDPGDYATFVKARVLDFDPAHTGNDLLVSVIRADTSAVLASGTFDLQSTAPGDPTSVPEDFIYRELTGPTFTAPGGVDLLLRVQKATTSTQSYDVDFMRYTASVATLDAGPITISAVVGGTTDGADVNVSLWF